MKSTYILIGFVVCLILVSPIIIYVVRSYNKCHNRMEYVIRQNEDYHDKAMHYEQIWNDCSYENKKLEKTNEHLKEQLLKYIKKCDDMMS